MPRTRLATAMLASGLGLLVAAPTTPVGAQAGGLAGEALGLDLDVRDIVLSVESLDGSVADAESTTTFETTLAGDVLFGYNRPDLAPVAVGILSTVADSIRTRAKSPVSIDGYTDSMGSADDNQDLSERRAATVKAELENLLVGFPFPLQAVGHGAVGPVSRETNPDGTINFEGRSRNRRVTISFTKEA